MRGVISEEMFHSDKHELDSLWRLTKQWELLPTSETPSYQFADESHQNMM